ncbi:glycosyltransferase family 2 protein [Christiangramia echinicola]|uniref:glycosyltransferase family 2 protein n=1 Tax=Christiangramia echinicola TaxID=279359 RepID=UPI0003F512CB|nr:glycosyltransferase family 2 protein [Christiangramia echinicola]
MPKPNHFRFFPMVELSIIYVNYNTKELTLNSISTVYQYTKKCNFEIIVVDNASHDNTISEIEKNFPEVKTIQNSKNIGFGRANNIGLKIAKGDFILFLNTDTYLEEPAIDNLLSELKKDDYKHVAVAGAKLIKPDGSDNISSGLLPSYPHFVKGSFLRYFYKRSFYDNLPQRFIPKESEPYKVDYVSGADFMVRRKVLNEVGGFNPRFFMYSEEVELSYRIYKTFPEMISMIFPSYKIVHISQGSSQKEGLNKKTRLRQIKSRSIYYSLTKGRIIGLIYYLTSMKRFFFN